MFLTPHPEMAHAVEVIGLITWGVIGVLFLLRRKDLIKRLVAIEILVFVPLLAILLIGGMAELIATSV